MVPVKLQECICRPSSQKYPQGNQQGEKTEGVCVTITTISAVGLLTVLLADRFAYVDFTTLEAKKVAIAMSESPLDGRRLLIKDGA